MHSNTNDDSAETHENIISTNQIDNKDKIATEKAEFDISQNLDDSDAIQDTMEAYFSYDKY